MNEIKSYIQSCMFVVVAICGLAFLSYIFKSCSGVIAQLYPEDEEYAVTDDEIYYHRTRCGEVNEYNISYYIDLETAIDEGLKPCPYCKPKTINEEQ